MVSFPFLFASFFSVITYSAFAISTSLVIAGLCLDSYTGKYVGTYFTLFASFLFLTFTLELFNLGTNAVSLDDYQLQYHTFVYFINYYWIGLFNYERFSNGTHRKMIAFPDRVIAPGQSYLISDYSFTTIVPDHTYELDLFNEYGSVRILPASVTVNIAWTITSSDIDILSLSFVYFTLSFLFLDFLLCFALISVCISGRVQFRQLILWRLSNICDICWIYWTSWYPLI